MIGKLLWTYYSPLWISEGLVTPEGSEGEKEKMKDEKLLLQGGIEHEMHECWPLHHQNIVVRGSRLEQTVLWNKRLRLNNPSLTLIEREPDWDDRYWT